MCTNLASRASALGVLLKGRHLTVDSRFVVTIVGHFVTHLCCIEAPDDLNRHSISWESVLLHF